MKVIRKTKTICLVLVVLLIAAIAAPASAVNLSSSTCSEKKLTQTGTKPVSTEITGPVADNLTNQALQDKNLMNLKVKMENEGYVKKEVKVYSVVVSKTDPSSTPMTGIAESKNPFQVNSADEYNVVGIRFESPDGQDEYIHYIVNKQTGETLVVMGSFDCVTCLFELGGAGAACFAVCTTLGGFTGGVACGACIGLAPLYVACPCWSCGCQMGQEFMCVAYDQKC